MARQVAFVFDLNKCIGCPTCVTACHQLWVTDEDAKDQYWITLSTQPGEGYPRGWEKMGGGYDRNRNLILGRRPGPGEVHDQVEYPWEEGPPVGSPPQMRPKSLPKWTINWEEDQGGGEWPNSWHFYQPKLCMECTNPPCLESCPSGAIFKREEDGIVVISESDCEGHRYCQRACPYKVISYNEVRKISQMCIGCVPRLEEGVAPACVRSCPARVIHFGYLDDRESSVHRLVVKWRVALPLHSEYNTGPNVFYVPPLSSSKLDEEGRYTDQPRIPLEYLESLFGDGARGALYTIQAEREKVREGGSSELIDLLVGWRWPDDFFHGFTKHPDEV